MNAGSVWQPMASVGTANTRALVTLLRIGQPFDGITIYCDEPGIKEYYKLDLLSGAAIDGDNVLATSIGGPSRWLKLSTSGGGATLLRNVVYVAKNGNDTGADGSISKPFLTVQAGLQYAWTTYVLPAEPQPAPPFTRATVYVCPGTYDDGPLVLPPQVCVMGMGANYSRIRGDWSIDDRWSNYAPPSLPSPPSVLVPSDMRSMFLLVGIFGNVVIDFDAHFSNEGKIWVQDVRFSQGNITVTEKVANPSSNQFYSQNCEHNGNVTMNGMNCQMTAPQFTSDPNGASATLILNQAGAAPDFNGTNYFVSAGGTIGAIVINATDPLAPPFEARFGHATQPHNDASFTLNGVHSTAKCNLNAVPRQGSIILMGGASQTQITDTNPVEYSGDASTRPLAPYVGQPHFDTPTGAPIWWDGTSWVNAPGVILRQSVSVSLGAIQGFGAVAVFTLSLPPALPANARLIAAEIKGIVPFAGPGLVSASGTEQSPGDVAGSILTGLDFMVAGNQAPTGVNPYASRAGHTIQITITLVGTTFDLLTAGSFDTNLFYSLTP